MEQIRLLDISKSFGVREIFHNISFDIKRGERVGLVGPNGAGKSTLLKCIMGIEEVDSGQIIISKGATLGYLKQDVNLGDASLEEEILTAWEDVKHIEDSIKELTKQFEITPATEEELERLSVLQDRFDFMGGYDYERVSRQIVKGMGFSEEEMKKPASAFSGGQKTRINVAKALVRRPDFLLLDEPTNHLDVETLEWLESFLTSYAGGILIVSHDRYFLDRVATSMVELNHHKARVYRGNYTRYLEQKAAYEKAYRKAYEKQQEHIRETEAFIEKYRAGIKSKMARGRQSQLNRLERMEALENDVALDFSFPKPAECADKVLVMQEVSVGYGDTPVLEDISGVIRRGEAVALVGPNGVGKTTLVKAIMGDLPVQEGVIDVGNRVTIGYLAQEHHELHKDWTIVEEITRTTALSEKEARSELGRFLFRGDDVFNLVGNLSGGEQARVALLKLFLAGDNFLILDEPTNHLDIPTREIVEDALLEFGGTYLVISHDRYFLNKIARKVFSLESGELKEYQGNYTYYKEQVEKAQQQIAEEAVLVEEAKEIEEEEKVSKSSYAKFATMNDFTKQKKLDEVEMKIAELEATVKMYHIQLENPELQTDLSQYETVVAALEATEEKLNIQYEMWEHLSE